MLKGNHITVRYGTRNVVDDISFTLQEGQWLMLVGPNGAGKSTLIETISQGVPYTGSIELGGQDIRRYKPAQLARKIGVLSQKNSVGYGYSVDYSDYCHTYIYSLLGCGSGNRCGSWNSVIFKKETISDRMTSNVYSSRIGL